jgi:hypothetical protein
MKTKSIFTYLVITIQIFVLVSCTKQNEKVIATDLKPVIEIKAGDILVVDLGNFGDEESAMILNAPKNAKESKIQRETNSSAIKYQYIPLDQFVGKDSVTLIINRGSDGSSLGVNDTTEIQLVVK